MSQSVTVANISIPLQDANGADINYQSFAESLAPLTVDSRYHLGSQLDDFDNTGTYKGQSTIIVVFLLTANNASALALYTTFKNGLAAGTLTNVWYSTQTLGV